MWMEILFLVGAIALIWILYRTVRGRPEMFSRENLSKSFFTMGVLALGLLVFIGFLVWMLRVA